MKKYEESETVELKKSLSQFDKGLKAICAFLNHKGGKVYFGVGDNGEVIGLQVSDRSLRKVSQQIHFRIKPEIAPEVKQVESIIEVKVKEGNNKPYFLNGIAYKRIGTENRIIPPDELKRMIIEQKKTKWDEEICEEAAIEDIDISKVKWFLEKRQIIRGKNKYGGMSWHQLLMNLGAISKNLKPTNAGILIFGNSPQKFIDVSEVRCARFKGNAMKEFIDSIDLKGSIFEMAESAMKFIERNIRTASRVVGIMSQYKREYPLDALREAIINALIHRDYMLNSNVRIAIFDDRIEIISPGGLMPGLTIDKLEGTHELRNKKLAKYFYEIGEIEKWGSGIIKMNMLMKQYGLNKPKYESNHQFKVIFYGPCEDILDLIKKPSEIIEMNERQKKALDYIKKDGSITNRRFRNLFSVTDRTALRDLDDLVTKNILKRVGKRRAARYELK